MIARDPTQPEHSCRCFNCMPVLGKTLERKPWHFRVPKDRRLHVVRVTDDGATIDFSAGCFQVCTGCEECLNPNLWFPHAPPPGTGIAWCQSSPAHICERCLVGACGFLEIGKFVVFEP